VQQSAATKTGPAFVFDLDGTLIDSVYQHVLAWREALEQLGVELAVWRTHCRIGMSGGLLVNALLREIGCRLTKAEAARLPRFHHEAYLRQISQVRLLPGASELLACLSRAGVPWAIATSGRRDSAQPMLELLRLEPKCPSSHGRRYSTQNLTLTCSWRLPGALGCRSASRSWLGTACRTCSPPAGLGLWEWVCFQAVTARMSSNAPVHIGFTKIPQTC
jgi:Haloacid dehalogenase-like hydrolase